MARPKPPPPVGRPSGPWLLAFQDGSLWVADGAVPDADRISLERLNSIELRRRFPRLAQAWAASNWKDCPRVVRTPG
jgi:hypothetical protein